MSEPRPTSPLSPQEQARIRRERRQAKVREGGNTRLSRITATQGSDFRKEELAAESSKPAARSLSSSPLPSDHLPATPDPPEIDISQQSTPARTHAAAHFSPTVSGEEELRQALMMDQVYRAQGADKTPGMDDRVDPFMQLFQQMAGGPFQGMENMGGLDMPPRMDIPPGMESMLSGMMDAQRGQETATESKTNGWAIWWTLLHAVVAMVVAVGALTSGATPFDGSEKQRIQSANVPASAKPQLFWYFGTMELVLQSTRFLMEKGRPPQGSMLTTVAGFLPPPFNTYLSTLARYSVFLWAILADAGVIIFALGVASWWNS